MEFSVLCPLDGRYASRVGTLARDMGEAALAVNRVRVEVNWLKILSGLKLPSFKKLTVAEQKILDKICALSAADLKLLEQL